MNLNQNVLKHHTIIANDAHTLEVSVNQVTEEFHFSIKGGLCSGNLVEMLYSLPYNEARHLAKLMNDFIIEKDMNDYISEKEAKEQKEEDQAEGHLENLNVSAGYKIPHDFIDTSTENVAPAPIRSISVAPDGHINIMVQ